MEEGPRFLHFRALYWRPYCLWPWQTHSYKVTRMVRHPYSKWVSDSFSTGICTQAAHSRCDERDIYTGKQKPANVPRCGYAHATKIHAAISHHFARECGLGRQPWIEAGDGTVTGNPSLAPSLATYMVSLQRRKVQSHSANYELKIWLHPHKQSGPGWWCCN